MTADDLLAAADTAGAVRGHATELGVDPDLADAVAHQESRYNPKAVSPVGAQGAMQVMPGTAKALEPKYGSDNLRQGVGYLKDMHDLYPNLKPEQQRQFALASYNAGPGRVASARRKAKAAGLDDTDFAAVSNFLPGETRDYVPAIVKRIGQGSGQTQVSVPDNNPSADDLLSLAGSAKPAAMDTGEPAPEPRGVGASLYDRTVGRTARAADAALGGLPSALGGALGAYSAGDEAGVQDALTAGGGTGERLARIPLGLAETGVTAAFPGTTAAQGAIGAGMEGLTGSKTVGDVSEVAAGLAPAVAGVARGGYNALKGLTSGPSVEQEISAGLGAGKTAQEVGHTLQAPGKGARGVISKTAEDSSRIYTKAQDAAKAGGAVAEPVSLAKAARQAVLDAKAAGGAVSGDAMRTVRNIRKLAVGTTSKVLGPDGQPIVSKAADIGADVLIEQQSNLRRAISKLPKDHPARSPLLELDDALENAITTSTAKVPEAAKQLGVARQRYRMTTIPTRKTMQRVVNAETPEGATRVLTQPNTPSRFGRFARAAKPGEADAVISAHWTDVMNKSHSDTGGLDLVRMSKNVSKLDPKQLKQMSNTPARRLTIKALRSAAKVQSTVNKIPVAAWSLAGAAGGVPGVVAGYAFGRVLKSALRSEHVARALYRTFQATPGSPGAKVATSALRKAMTAMAPAARAGVAALEDNDE